MLPVFGLTISQHQAVMQSHLRENFALPLFDAR
jgi:hypothetical protein